MGGFAKCTTQATTRRLWKCYGCRKQFTVTVGTIFEASHVSLIKWLAAFYLLCASKKGMSAPTVHRIREAMKAPRARS